MRVAVFSVAFVLASLCVVGPACSGSGPSNLDFLVGDAGGPTQASRVDSGGGLTEGGSPATSQDGASDVAVPFVDAASPADAAASLGSCTLPTGARWADAQAAYAKWKTDLVTSSGARGFLRVRRPNSTGAIDTSNSEGTAYGMILAAVVDGAVSGDDERWILESRGEVKRRRGLHQPAARSRTTLRRNARGWRTQSWT